MVRANLGPQVQATREQAPNYGCLVVEKESAEVLHYVEKPTTFVSQLADQLRRLPGAAGAHRTPRRRIPATRTRAAGDARPG